MLDEAHEIRRESGKTSISMGFRSRRKVNSSDGHANTKTGI